MIGELIVIAVIVLVSQYYCKVVLELTYLAVLTSRTLLFCKLYFQSCAGAFSQTSALPVIALMVLTCMMLLGREELSNFKLLSFFTSQSRKGQGGSV